MDIEDVKRGFLKTPEPIRPNLVPDIAEAILSSLAKEPSSENLVLGGGFALRHYDDFRPTQDIDAWWKEQRDQTALDSFYAQLGALAVARGLTLEHRSFRDTDSFDFKNNESRKKVFSLQVAVRDVELEEPQATSWPPILIESFLDNVGSKMSALVNRGAPRDFIDVFQIVSDELISVEGCWMLWQLKNPNSAVDEAKQRSLSSLTLLEVRRPLETIAAPWDRETARSIRNWIRTELLPLSRTPDLGPGPSY